MQTDKIVGVWKGKVQFKTGDYAKIKDFEFMYVFNSGGFTPSGYRIIIEEITLNDDGNSYSSFITMTLFDKDGSYTGVDEAEAVRMEFDKN
jgi:hypothetical protein